MMRVMEVARERYCTASMVALGRNCRAMTKRTDKAMVIS